MSLAKTAKRLIDEKGDTITLTTKTVGTTYDTTTGTYNETETTHQARGVFDSNVVRGDRMTLSSNIEINEHTRILHNGMNRRIKNIISVQTDDNVIIYEVEVTDDKRAL